MASSCTCLVSSLVKGGLPAGCHLHAKVGTRVLFSPCQHNTLVRHIAKFLELYSTILARIGTDTSRSVLCCLMSAIRGLTTTTSAQSLCSGAYSALHRSPTRSCSLSFPSTVLGPSLVQRQSAAVNCSRSQIRRRCTTSQVTMAAGDFVRSIRPVDSIRGGIEANVFCGG